MRRPVAVIFHRLGPYHHARLHGVSKLTSLLAIEVVRKDSTYAWDIVDERAPFRCCTLFPSMNGSGPSPAGIARRLANLLSAEHPAAVVVPGWSAPEALAALSWAIDRRVPAIVMSDSQQEDYSRNAFQESVKRRIVSLCSAALVAGSRHRDYACALGMTEDRIFAGYDVTDNWHFTQGAEAARRDLGLRQRLGLPDRYFVVSTRFIPEKNLPSLIDAYAQYRSRAGSNAWSIVLLGDGPLRSQILDRIRRHALDGMVHLPGFRQYEELPTYYGLADALILPSVKDTWGLVVNEAMAAGLPVIVSNRCGCAPDLVEEGRNGFRFDPYNVEELANLMLKVSSMSDEERRKMGEASQEIISRWTPQTFAENLMKAVDVALSAPPPKATLLDKALLWALIHRPHFSRA